VNAAILFEPDGYLLDGPKLMGRQAAGDGFLRAAVKAHGGRPLVAYTAAETSAEAFRARVAELDPAAQTRWIHARRLDLLGEAGVLYRPDHAIGLSARARLRVGLDRYALCGVTHTLASAGAMEIIADLPTAPVAPWDAIVCTSTAAVGVMETALSAQEDYLAWRLGGRPAARPMLPMIPLGVHGEDFAFSAADRAAARAALGLAEDEVAALFAGRLSFNGKAHPFPMYVALQAAAEATGRRLVLVHAGQFANAAIESAFRSAAVRFCPDVRCVFLDGKDPELYRQSWRAADVFMSLSDSIQETFGITPVEAMAAGLPVIVTDWNGYKDTVRDGVDGFRIATWQPSPGAGTATARDYELESLSYDAFLSRASTAVALDMRRLRACVRSLVADAELRRRMGAAGQARVRELFDWSVVWRRYQALWAEQDAMRRRARQDHPSLFAGAPTASPRSPDPFAAFAHYPTAHVSGKTILTAAPGADAASYASLTEEPLLSFWKISPALSRTVFDALANGSRTVADLADAAGLTLADATELAARLAKMDLVELEG
jgi:glycosyltransferase involved in cell wall biosynthesis